MAGLTDSGNFNQYAAPVVTSWNSTTTAGAQGVGTAVTLNTAGLDTVAITISSPSTITGGTIQFNVWDGAAYIPVKCARLSTYNTDSSYTIPNLGTAQLQGWTVPAAGYPQFQFLLTSAITGTGNVTITTIPSSAPDVSIVTAGIDPQSTLPTYAANATQSTGLSSIHAFNAAGTTTVAIKATAGKLHNVTLVNLNTTVAYVKFFNVAGGTAVSGLTPVITYALPGATTVTPGVSTVIDRNLFGTTFSTAMSYYVSTVFTDTADTAATANTVLVQLDYV